MVRDPLPHEVIVKVHSAALNPADWKSCDGEQQLLLSFDWPRVIGFDFSGEIYAIGSEVSKFKIGDNVFGMIQGLPERDRGTLQEFFVVNEKVCALKPENITHQQAAAIPLVGITAVKMFQKIGLVATKQAKLKNEVTTQKQTMSGETKQGQESTNGLRVLVTGYG